MGKITVGTSLSFRTLTHVEMSGPGAASCPQARIDQNRGFLVSDSSRNGEFMFRLGN